MKTRKVSVLFVCLGNICRSPTAHGVFQAYVDRANLSHLFHIDSAGTASWHEGESPDQRSTAEAKKRGYDLSPLRGRQAVAEDFNKFDYILAMDSENLTNLQAIAPADKLDKAELFLNYSSNTSIEEVPDPYNGGQKGFTHVLELVEDACENLLESIKNNKLA